MKTKKRIDWISVIRVAAAIGISLLIAAAIIFVVAEDPVTALKKFLLGPFTTKRNFFNVIETMIPLVFCGLAINVMHKSGLFSMAADSSFYFSGVVAAAIAIALPMPNILHQIVILAIIPLNKRFLAFLRTYTMDALVNSHITQHIMPGSWFADFHSQRHCVAC